MTLLEFPSLHTAQTLQYQAALKNGCENVFGMLRYFLASVLIFSLTRDKMTKLAAVVLILMTPFLGASGRPILAIRQANDAPVWISSTSVTSELEVTQDAAIVDNTVIKGPKFIQLEWALLQNEVGVVFLENRSTPYLRVTEAHSDIIDAYCSADFCGNDFEARNMEQSLEDKEGEESIGDGLNEESSIEDHAEEIISGYEADEIVKNHPIEDGNYADEDDSFAAHEQVQISENHEADANNSGHEETEVANEDEDEDEKPRVHYFQNPAPDLDLKQIHNTKCNHKFTIFLRELPKDGDELNVKDLEFDDNQNTRLSHSIHRITETVTVVERQVTSYATKEGILYNNEEPTQTWSNVILHSITDAENSNSVSSSTIVTKSTHFDSVTAKVPTRSLKLMVTKRPEKLTRSKEQTPKEYRTRRGSTLR